MRFFLAELEVSFVRWTRKGDRSLLNLRTSEMSLAMTADRSAARTSTLYYFVYPLFWLLRGSLRPISAEFLSSVD